MPYRLMYLTVLLVFMELSGCAHTEEIKPFVSDGCSRFPDGTMQAKKLWLQCCIEHDKKYWQGGTRKQRHDADLELRQCVKEVGKPLAAKIMHAGVVVGGSPYWPTKFRWGYGWSYLRGYKPLNQDEQKLVRKVLKQNNHSKQ